MSNTPRTDEAEKATMNPDYEYVGAEVEAWEFARKLERELAEMTEDRDTLDGHLAHATGLAHSRLNIIRQLERELNELRRDKARLEFLLHECCETWSDDLGRVVETREDIDAAMEEAK